MIIELKWSRSAKTALNQILDKNYPDAFKHYSGPILAVGISYSKKTRKHTAKVHELVKD